MTQLSVLGAGLMRSRQRVAVERLRNLAQPLLPPVVAATDAVESSLLATKLQAQLELRRPQEAGELLVTGSEATFTTMVSGYFRQRAGVTFHAFLAHWEDVGALIMAGSHLAEWSVRLLRFDGDALYGCNSEETEVFSLDITTTGAGDIYELFFFPSAR